MNVALIHLELGVGGTEQLLVNAAICLLNMGHDVKIYTSHYDQDHCFAEAKRGGKLADKIVTCGDWLPRCDVCSWGFFVLGGGGGGGEDGRNLQEGVFLLKKSVIGFVSFWPLHLPRFCMLTDMHLLTGTFGAKDMPHVVINACYIAHLLFWSIRGMQM